ncbi:MAG: hypothetical protein AAFV26_02415, partial [Pseudomonadota bacterium]
VPELKDRSGGGGQKPDFNTTIVPRSDRAKQADQEAPADSGTLMLEAALTSDGQTIDNGLTWRIFQRGIGLNAAPRLLQTVKQADPRLQLAPGTYFVNAAYGQANLTRRVVVLANGRLLERFVLNAGGLRADVMIGEVAPPPQSVRLKIFSDESDQSGQRKLVINNLRPGVVARLNAGIYFLESRVGRANAVVRSQVSVEAGKLTVAKVSHQAATITFKLVTKAGGEAIAGTRWTIIADSGDVIRESVGALPRHVLAPGTYTVSAISGGQSYRRSFRVQSGRNADVEVLQR